MTAKTSAQLQAEIAALFPDNTIGEITPAILRQVTADMVTSVMPTAPVGSGNIAVFDGTTGLLKDGGNSISGTFQIVTAPGDVTVLITDTLIILNKTSSQVTNVNLPPSATKIGAVKVVDFKGDSGSFPITVVPHGSELFNAAQTSWPISGAGASATFDPIITGLGYAV